MTSARHPTLARVDLGAIAANFRLLASRTGRRVLAVVKADAYGHGAVAVSRALAAAGADFFCVATVDEGIELRRAGLRETILILSRVEASEVPLLRAYGLTATLSSLAQIHEFREATQNTAPPLPVHLKFDTGLTRLGVLPSECAGALELLRSARGLAIEAVFSHFSHGTEPAHPSLAREEALSTELFATVRNAGISYRFTHLGSSGAATSGRRAASDAIRPGLTLYGVSPLASSPEEGLTPALSWESEIVAIKDVPAGTPVGYGGHFVTERPSRLAILPVGYHDGYRRVFSGRIPVLLPGGAVSTVGVISMDVTVCDVTEISASRGERAVLLGRTSSGVVSAHDMARADSTIPYEILCGIGSRVPRVYL